MADGFTVELTIPREFLDNFRLGLKKKIENPGDEAMYAIHDLLAKEFEPYVPTKEGVMVHGVEVTPEYIKYPGPYAHYQYMGEVYGPNIAQWDEAGEVVVGWKSPKGKGSKHPTGRPLGAPGELLNSKGEVAWVFGYTNPQSTSHWDRVALAENREKIENQIRDIIIESWKNDHR